MKRRAEIVIVTWNGKEDTLAALEAIEPQRSDERLVTVVDNGSVDGTADEVARRFPHVRLLRSSANRGFTGGVGLAASCSTADYLVLLNNDAVPEPGWLDAFVSGIEAAPPDVVALAGRIVDPTSSRVDFIGGAMTFDGHAFQLGFRKPRGEVAEPEDGSELLFACGGNMIVRREAFAALGGFDDDYFAYLEDVDFGWRAWIAGWRIVYHPAATVRHKSSATSDRLGAFERGVLFERNALTTVLKNYDEPMLRESAGAVFLTLLHRLSHYLTSRNDVSVFRRPPFGSGPASHGSASARVDDPLTVMQARAMSAVFDNMLTIMRKRETVQRMRRRSDAEIFRRFPLLFVATYPGDAELMSGDLFAMLRPRVPSADLSLMEIMER